MVQHTLDLALTSLLMQMSSSAGKVHLMHRLPGIWPQWPTIHTCPTSKLLVIIVCHTHCCQHSECDMMSHSLLYVTLTDLTTNHHSVIHRWQVRSPDRRCIADPRRYCTLIQRVILCSCRTARPTRYDTVQACPPQAPQRLHLPVAWQCHAIGRQQWIAEPNA